MSISGTEVYVEDTYGDGITIWDGYAHRKGPRIYLQIADGPQASLTLSQATKVHDALAGFISENTPLP